MRDWVIAISLALFILFVFYCWRKMHEMSVVGEGMANQELIAINQDFMLPLLGTTEGTTDTSKNIVAALTQSIQSGNAIGWRHTSDISLCNVASPNIATPTVTSTGSKPQYVIFRNANNAISQTVDIASNGEYILTINACGNNPISVDLSSNGTSKLIHTFTPTPTTWQDYTKQFTINDASGTETLSITGTGTTAGSTTGISSVSLKSMAIAGDTQSTVDIKKAITDVSNNIRGKLDTMATSEDAQFSAMLAAINKITGSINDGRSTSSGSITTYTRF